MPPAVTRGDVWKSRCIPQRRGLARQPRESLRGRPVMSQGTGMSPALPCGMVKNTRKDCCDHDASNLRSAQHNGMPPASGFPEVRTQQRLVPPLIQRWIPHERQHYKHSFSPPPRTEPRRVPRNQPPRTETGRSAGGGCVATASAHVADVLMSSRTVASTRTCLDHAHKRPISSSRERERSRRLAMPTLKS